MIPCRWCPCCFFTIEDMHQHYQTYGFTRERHILKWHDEQERRKKL